MAKSIRYTPPPEVCEETRNYLALVVKELNAGSNIKSVDIPVLNMLARAHNRLVRASVELSKVGETFENYRGDTVTHPLVKIEKDCESRVVRLITEYGLTLKSRESMTVTKSKDSDDSPLDDFIKEGRSL